MKYKDYPEKYNKIFDVIKSKKFIKAFKKKVKDLKLDKKL